MRRAYPSLRLIERSILTLEPAELADGAPYKVVANLPYYLTSAVLRQFLDTAQRPSLLVTMVQKEVAERICAGPGDMSTLSVSVQAFAAPEIVRIVSRDAFYPVPEVNSAIVRLRVRAMPVIAVQTLSAASSASCEPASTIVASSSTTRSRAISARTETW